MIRVSVLYPATATRFDYDYYLNKHTPMVLELWKPCGLKGVEISRGVSGLIPGSTPAYCTVTMLNFESIESFQTALAAGATQVIADLANFTDVQPEIQVNESLD
jgi:uncharacterized protein (TIGR02118 family)